MLGISTQTVYRMVREGTLPHFRVGGQLRFERDEVVKALRDTPVVGDAA